MSWITDLQKVENIATNAINNGISKIKDTFSNTVNRTVAEVESAFKNGHTVVGINVNNIPAMKESVRKYVDNIKTALNELNAYDPEVAFKGEYAQAMTVYIEAVKTACNAICSQMLAFNDQLTKVQEAYQAKDQATASTIKQTAESTSSAYTKYQEQSN